MEVNDIRVGDYIHLTVPYDTRSLAKGKYRATVNSILPVREKGEQRYSINVRNRAKHALVSCLLTLIEHPNLIGKGFLGTDTCPVDCTHEQNLEQRLRDSLAAKGKGE